MATVDAFEARAHLAALLNRVARGEKITITRHGIPAAVLVPVADGETKLSHREVMERMRVFRKRVKPDDMSTREMIEEGRRN